MKMWKIAAIVSLLIVPSAFGGVSLRLDDGTATPQLGENIAPATNFIVGVWLDINPALDLANGVGGVSALLISSDPTHTAWVSRAKNNASKVMTNLITGNAAVIAGGFELASAKDIGGYDNEFDPSDETTGPALTTERLMNLTLKLLPGATYPVTLTLGLPALSRDNGAKIEMDTAAARLSYVVTPEPVSALLVAVGAAFFARRRRVA